ncbi:MAG: S53 family peptidase [Blastocatellia bacterium]
MKFLRVVIVIISLLVTFFLLKAFDNLQISNASNITQQSNIKRKEHIGQIPFIATPDNYLGKLSSNERILLIISFEARNEEKLQQLITELYDSESANYHKWLTPKDFGKRFGRDRKEFESAINWLKEQGFTIEAAWDNNLSIVFSGNTQTVEKAFSIEMGRFINHQDSRVFYSNLQEPQLPALLENITISLVGLNDAYHAGSGTRSKAVKNPQKQAINPNGVTSGGTNFLSPRDVALAYNITPISSAGFQGQGQKVGVIFDSDILDSDINSLRRMYDLPAGTIKRLIPPGVSSPGVKPGEQGETTLDVSAISYIAPLAEINIILIPDLRFSMIILAEQFAVNLGTIPVVNESIVACEDAFNPAEQMIFRQAVAQGIAFFASSGDEGIECTRFFSNGPRTSNSAKVSLPAMYDGVTAVGGTQIQGNYSSNGDLESIILESVWNVSPGVRFDCNGRFSFGPGASGGGVSDEVLKPDYQIAAGGFTGGVPESQGRYVPDVSLLAGPPYVLIFLNGRTFLFEGTSLASPLWAGMMVLVNQVKGSIQGAANREIYRLGVKQFRDNGPAVYRDITTGNNSTGVRMPCASNGVVGINAGFGYDGATGWGVPDFDAFVKNYGEANEPGEPVIATVVFNKPNLVISGNKFGVSGAKVEVNGLDISSRIVNQSNSLINLKGNKKKLNLKAGNNTAKIISSNGSSNVFSFNF